MIEDQKPATVGRVVWYRSRTGKYTVPAIVVATHDSLFEGGVAAGFVPNITGEGNVHLVVFTPGKPGKRGAAEDFVARADAPISENAGGVYQEWDVPPSEVGDVTPGDGCKQAAGTWAWPVISPVVAGQGDNQ